MKTIILLLVLLSAGGWQDAMLYLTGASSAEELDQSTLEHFQALNEHPIDLNSARKSRLLSSGLFTTYQAASIIDYRSTHGDILSYAELAAVNGIGSQVADALRPFTVLKSRKLPGAINKDSEKLSASSTLRSTCRQDTGAEAQVTTGAKLAFGWNDYIEASAALRYSYDGKSQLELPSATLSYEGRRYPGKVMLGDFNLRLGQGMLMWSGFNLTSLLDANSFQKRPTGISRALSFSSDSHLRGVAADAEWGRFSCLAAYVPQSALTAASFSWTGRTMHISTNAVYSKEHAGASIDFHLGKGNLTGYGEAAYDLVSKIPAVCLGMLWRPRYGSSLAAQVRTQKDEYVLLAGYSGKSLRLSSDYAIHPVARKSQFRILSQYSPQFKISEFLLKPQVRISARYRGYEPNKTKIDLRNDCELEWQEWMIHCRYNMIWYEHRSQLAYVEAGYRSALSAYLRFTAFDVEKWNDRIYVYERDAPGSFNVPAYYGEGWSASAVASYKLRAHHIGHRFYVRCSYLTYPRMSKASRIDVRLQYVMVI